CLSFLDKSRREPQAPMNGKRTFLSAVLSLALPGAAAAAQDVPVTDLFGSGTTARDEFGWDTALRGDWLLVGAPKDHHLDPPGHWLSGRVYAFRRDADTGAWEEADLWFPEAIGFEGGGAFGDALALSSDGRLAA